MQAHTFLTMHDAIGRYTKLRPANEWYRKVIATISDRLGAAQAATEDAWTAAAKPYYTVYPAAADVLARVKLDVPCGLIVPPLDQLLIRFGIDREPLCNGNKLRSILFGALGVNDAEGVGGLGIGVWCDFGERVMDRGHEMPDYTFVTLSLVGDRSIEECLADATLNTADGADMTAMREALRFVIACCLLGPESELIEPDVLSKDRAKWDETKDPAIAERAIRRGKCGWLVGEAIDLAPHVRRPHFGLRWTGEGRKIPRIVPISGSIIRKHKLTDVPTGHLGNDVG